MATVCGISGGKIMEHPILFTGDMVRAILEGRKTQTRRVIKIQPEENCLTPWLDDDGTLMYRFEDGRPIHQVKCPYGAPGDRLWVRETHARIPGNEFAQVHYIADGPIPSISERHDAGLLRVFPSIHMPRWASRIALEVVELRVERVQDITPEDAKAEGVAGTPVLNLVRANTVLHSGVPEINAFHTLWDSINGKKHPWESNPWVWVPEWPPFKKATK